jgi:hypothetical protein
MTENVDVQREALGEKIEIVQIGLGVLRERIEELDRKLASLERSLLE